MVTILSTAGLGRADVWVFDATNFGASLGGTPEHEPYGFIPRGSAHRRMPVQRAPHGGEIKG
jgi:hypothetical protein